MTSPFRRNKRNPVQLRDRDVRASLYRVLRANHEREPDTCFIHELGLRHGACRVDIAVVNGFMHGYEIKSEADSLERLPAQIEIYSGVLDFATLVVCPNHVDRARKLLPDWWGICVASPTTSAEPVKLTYERAASRNTALNPIAVAELLWSSEAAGLLKELGASDMMLRVPRAQLYRMLAVALPSDILTSVVRETLKRRTGWRNAAHAARATP